MSKTTGLDKFKNGRTSKVETPSINTAPQERQRGKGDIVSITVRLTRDQWRRLHELAVTEGVSFQTLAIRGLSRPFEDQGLPPL